MMSVVAIPDLQVFLFLCCLLLPKMRVLLARGSQTRGERQTYSGLVWWVWHSVAQCGLPRHTDAKCGMGCFHQPCRESKCCNKTPKLHVFHSKQRRVPVSGAERRGAGERHGGGAPGLPSGPQAPSLQGALGHILPEGTHLP